MRGFVFCVLCFVVLCGCVSGPVAPVLTVGDVAGLYRGDENAAAVVCGLTGVDPARYGGWRGACPGSDVDAGVFAVACESNGVSYELLLNGEATAGRIEAAARAAVAGLRPGGVLILYYSGHGGQVADAGDASEGDGKSETLCLWDGPLTDNVVWRLLCLVPEGVRVWMVTDSCNSGTNYRGVHDYTRALRARGEAGRGPDLLHWGGCADGEFSYGSAQGGVFTTALVDSYRQGQSYAEWFEGARRKMPAGQRPTREWAGADFQGRRAFR